MSTNITLDEADDFAQKLIEAGWHNDDPDCVAGLQRLLQVTLSFYMMQLRGRIMILEAQVDVLLPGTEAHQPLNVGVDAAVAAARAPLIYPEELTPMLRDVLGFMIFRASPIARVFRAAGYDIKIKPEDEQAFVLHRMIRTVLTHGADWAEVFSAQVRAAGETAAERGNPHATAALDGGPYGNS